jgi:hypothetical protein
MKQLSIYSLLPVMIFSLIAAGQATKTEKDGAAQSAFLEPQLPP